MPSATSVVRLNTAITDSTGLPVVDARAPGVSGVSGVVAGWAVSEPSPMYSRNAWAPLRRSRKSWRRASVSVISASSRASASANCVSISRRYRITLTRARIERGHLRSTLPCQPPLAPRIDPLYLWITLALPRVSHRLRRAQAGLPPHCDPRVRTDACSNPALRSERSLPVADPIVCKRRRHGNVIEARTGAIGSGLLAVRFRVSRWPA